MKQLMTLLFIYLGIALFVSFLCSILEASLLSTTRSHLYAISARGLKYATVWLQFKEKVDKPLSAILSLNTIANTIGALGVGSQVTLIFGSQYLGWASGILTILILLFAEIIPKTLGARYWRSIIPFMGGVLQFLVILLSPFVWVTNSIAQWIAPPATKSITSYREELHALASMAKKEGAFPDKDYKILSNLIFFNKILVEDIMTPRTVVIAVSDKTTLEEIYNSSENTRFSRVPIYEKNIDNVIGFFLKSDLLNAIIKGKNKSTVKEIMRPIYMTHELTPVPVLFEELVTRKEHISVVVDSYGGMSGVATMEDIIETFFGIEIMDELDSKTDMQAYARDKWKERALKLGILEQKFQ
jgi:CBS domain containing-hemolysin-like protein